MKVIVLGEAGGRASLRVGVLAVVRGRARVGIGKSIGRERGDRSISGGRVREGGDGQTIINMQAD